MDYPLKLRIEIGPGIPSQLARLQTPDARKALLQALYEMITMGSIPAGYIGKATEGSTTVCLSLSRGRVFSEPSGSIPCSHINEYEVTVEVESPEEAKFRAQPVS